MTVTNTLARWEYTGDNVTKIFAYTNKIFAAADLRVFLDEVEQVSGFTVSGVGVVTGGSVTFTVAPGSAVEVLITSEIVQDQQTAYVEGDPFPAASHEDALDKLTLLVNQLQDQVDRCVKWPATEATVPTSELPVKPLRLSQLLGFGGTLGELVPVTPSDPTTLLVSSYIETLLDDADDAAARTTLDAQEELLNTLTTNGEIPFRNGAGALAALGGTEGESLRLGASNIPELGMAHRVEAIASSFTLSLPADDNKIFTYNDTVARTVTLPQITAGTVGARIRFEHTKTTSPQVLTITADAADQIGAHFLTGAGGSIALRQNGCLVELIAEAVGLWRALDVRLVHNEAITSLSAAGLTTITHSNNAFPTQIQIWMECQTADGGYAIGDFMLVNQYAINRTTAHARGLAVTADTVDVVLVRIGADGLDGLRKDTAATFSLTLGSWDIIARLIWDGRNLPL
jgi:hypothetical protein